MQIEVKNKPAEGRYEIFADGVLAGWAAYHRENGRVVFSHTRVIESYYGLGLGTELIRSAVKDVCSQGTEIVALCPFVDRYISENRSNGFRGRGASNGSSQRRTGVVARSVRR